MAKTSTKVTAAAVVVAIMASGATTKPGHHVIAHLTAATSSGGSVSANITLGRKLAARRGWTGHQFTCLDELWERESGWSQFADTRVTHAGGDNWGSPVFAYGIAQARPATKMPKAGWPPDLGGRSNPEVQIKWGFGHINDTYGTPCRAWSHEEADGWY